jgi:hypothetical protein
MERVRVIETGRSRAAGGRRRGWFWWPLLGYFLLFGAWAVAMPYGGYPDEFAHVYNAYGATSGELVPALATTPSGWPGTYRDVPHSLVGDLCAAFHPQRTAACAAPPTEDRTPRREFVQVGRYNPAYYLVIGVPIRLLPNPNGVMLARLISAGIVAVFFAWATSVALRLPARGVLVGIVVALTPMTAYLAGGVNPSATEIASGLALAVSLRALVVDESGVHRVPAWRLLVVSAVTLLVVRPTGPLVAAVIAFAIGAPLVARLRRGIPRDRRMWLTFGGLTVVGLLAVAWTLWRHALQVVPSELPRHHMGVPEAISVEIFNRWSAMTPELVGVMGWLDTPLPSFVHVAWWMAIGSVVVVAVAVGRAADRWRVLSLGALGMLVPSVLEAIRINQYGWINQGRYFLPMLVGVPFLAAVAISTHRYAGLLDGLTRVCAIALAPLHVFVLDWTMMRYQSGLPGPQTAPALNPLDGAWHPAVGSVTPLVLAACGVSLLAVFCWRATTPSEAGA